MKLRPKRLIIWGILLLAAYLALGGVLRLTGVLHPYWGRYILLAPAPRSDFSRVLATDPFVFRPVYAIERLLSRRNSLHVDRMITGTLTHQEVENTFHRSLRRSVPPSFQRQASGFRDTQYLDIMERTILFYIPEAGRAELDRLIDETRSAARLSEEDDLYFSDGAPPLAAPVPFLGFTFEQGSSEYEVSAPDFGCLNQTRILLSPDRRHFALHWRIDD
jgi:hypothetical protein